MADFETVEESSVDIPDPIIQKQKEDVANMRTSLLAFDGSPGSARQALSNITVLRMYHQVARIIRYIEMMDKIEAKMYESIDHSLEAANTSSPATWMMLVELQEKLQKNMIDSHKLLQPYIDQMAAVDEFVNTIEHVDTPKDALLPQESRDKLRSAAQSVIKLLDAQSSNIKE